MTALGALLAGTALAVAPASAPGAEPEPRAAAKKCLWNKRDCHPPARLWYRVSVSLKAEQIDNLDRPPTEFSSGETHLRKTTERWTMRSNHAIRLTLRCVDVSRENETPFLDKQRINGRRRTIGGCAKRRGHRPTLRFAATAAGEVTSFEATDTFGPSEVVHPAEGIRRCEGRQVSQALVSSQPLAGTISTPDSQSGLAIDAQASSPFGAIHLTTTAYTCEQNGTAQTTEARAFDLRFGDGAMIGGNPLEGIFDKRFDSWRPLYGFLFLTPRAANFGGDYIIQRRVTQPELAPGTFPAPPPGLAVAPLSAKDYTYTIRLEPCPNRGLDVKRC